MRALLAAVRPEPGERGRLALSVALAAGATGAAIGLLATSGYLISRAAQRPMIISLMVTIVAVRAFGITRAALRYAERLSSHDLALRQLARLRAEFYRRLAPLVPGQLRGLGRGDLLGRFVADIDVLQDAHLRIVMPALVAMAVVGGASLAAALMLGAAGAVMLVALSTAAIVTTWASAAVAWRSSRLQGPARTRLTAQLVEAIDGSAELALAGRARAYAGRLVAADRELARLGRRDAAAQALAAGLHSLLTGAGMIAVLIVGIDAVHAGRLPGVLLAALAFLFLGAGEALAPLPLAARRLPVCAAAAEGLEDVVAPAPAVVDAPGVRAPAGRRSALALEHVALRYGPEEELVLGDADLRLEPGEAVALTGGSGAGKTTVAELLVRFLDPVAGRVTLDGVDLRELTQDGVRAAVLLCGQDAHLFNTTVRENLLIANRAADEAALWEALAVVEMDAFVAGLPEGLDTLVGQEGELVSGGQRRRIALARALLSPARFLVLDEPVAHLDAPAARRVMARVLAARGERGLLVITHNLDTLDGFDRVLRLEAGRLEAGRREAGQLEAGRREAGQREAGQLVAGRLVA